MKIKATKLVRRLADGQAVISVTLEDDDEEYTFAADAWQLLDPEEFAKILHNWKTKIIPSKKAIAKARDVEIEGLINALQGLEITDDIDDIKVKIESRVKEKVEKIKSKLNPKF